MSADRERGFTLVELLVVIIIIGVLSAVAIPLFLNQQRKAQDSAARADVSTLGHSVGAWFVDHDSAPVLAQDAVSGDYTLGGDKVSSASTHVVLGPSVLVSREDWCVSVRNPRGAVSAAGLEFSSQDGLREGSC